MPDFKLIVKPPLDEIREVREWLQSCEEAIDSELKKAGIDLMELWKDALSSY